MFCLVATSTGSVPEAVKGLSQLELLRVSNNLLAGRGRSGLSLRSLCVCGKTSIVCRACPLAGQDPRKLSDFTCREDYVGNPDSTVSRLGKSSLIDSIPRLRGAWESHPGRMGFAGQTTTYSSKAHASRITSKGSLPQGVRDPTLNHVVG